jgi:hypothetical protein
VEAGVPDDDAGAPVDGRADEPRRARRVLLELA